MNTTLITANFKVDPPIKKYVEDIRKYFEKMNKSELYLSVLTSLYLMISTIFSDPDSRVKSRVPKVTKRKVLVTFPTEVLIEYDLKKKYTILSHLLKL